jgi:ADP-ribosylglycohydrolase
MSQIRKCLIYQAYADAYGKFVEFLTQEQIAKLYPNGLTFSNAVPNSHSDCWSKYEWTDDTDQTLLVMRAIATADLTLETPYLVAFARALKGWYKDGFPEYSKLARGIGTHVRWVVQEVNYVDSPAEASRLIWEMQDQDVTENGALMRTGIIGAVVSDYSDIARIAMEIAQATHWDSRCIAVCIYQSLLVRMLLDRTDDNLVNCVKNTLVMCKDYMDDAGCNYLCTLISPVIDGRYDPGCANVDDPYERGSIECTLPIAVWGLLQIRHRDFFCIIRYIASLGGDADTNCAVCGVLIGTVLPMTCLPDDYKELEINIIRDNIRWQGKTNVI